MVVRGWTTTTAAAWTTNKKREEGGTNIERQLVTATGNGSNSPSLVVLILLRHPGVLLNFTGILAAVAELVLVILLPMLLVLVLLMLMTMTTTMIESATTAIE